MKTTEPRFKEYQEAYDLYNILGGISNAIVEYRIANKLSQTQLAEKLGVRQEMISKYESGSYNMSIEKLNSLCHALNMSLTVLIQTPYRLISVSYSADIMNMVTIESNYQVEYKKREDFEREQTDPIAANVQIQSAA